MSIGRLHVEGLGQRFLAVVGGDHVNALQAQVERNEADDVLVVVCDQHHIAHGLVPFQRAAQRRVVASRTSDGAPDREDATAASTGRSGVLPRGIVGGCGQRWIWMTSLSVSLPQVTLLQPKISALATAVPCLKVLPPLAWTRTVICWPDPVQPTLVEPKP
jgi:hypothetical protein